MHRFRDLVKEGCRTLTREAFATSCHVSLRTVAYWLTGSVPTRGTLMLIERAVARAAGVTVDAVRAAVEHERALSNDSSGAQAADPVVRT